MLLVVGPAAVSPVGGEGVDDGQSLVEALVDAWADLLPAASKASTANVKLVPQVRLPTLVEVPDVLETNAPLTYTLYPAAGSVPSTEAVQTSAMLLVVGPAAVSPVGGEGVDPLAGCVTTPLASEVALVDPRRLAATTLKRRVEPRSAEARVWVVPVAPVIGAQLSPPLSQRSHTYEYRAPQPVQPPTEPVSVAPTSAVPLIVGAAVLTGADFEEAAELPLAKTPRSAASDAATIHFLRLPCTVLVSAYESPRYFPHTRV